MSAEDNTDALRFPWQKPKENPTVEVDSASNEDDLPTVDPDSEYYSNENKKGIALIFNHYKFDSGLLSREGTKKDCEDLETMLSKLNFDVLVHNDLKYGAIYEELKRVSQMDYSKYDCLFVAVMSHGDTGKIYAKDHDYSPDELWNPFNGASCKGLVGKPKLFFIQACRGESLDDGVKVRAARISHDSTNTYKLPTMADILVMFSTFEGHYSFRSPVNGSWFIQSLCKELEEKASTEDMLSILTGVNRRLAVGYQSQVPKNKDFHEKKQIAMVVSTLTKKFSFNL